MYSQIIDLYYNFVENMKLDVLVPFQGGTSSLAFTLTSLVSGIHIHKHVIELNKIERLLQA